MTFVADTPFVLVLAAICTVIISNVQAHTAADNDEHLITTQLVYWWICWSVLLGIYGESFSAQ
jgi:hypothetical protein